MADVTRVPVSEKRDRFDERVKALRAHASELRHEADRIDRDLDEALRVGCNARADSAVDP